MLRDVEARSRASSCNSGEFKAMVMQRLAKFGFPDPEMALFNVHRFVTREAPIITWFQPFQLLRGKFIIEHMAAENRLQSFLEMGSESCDDLETKIESEQGMFGSKYHHALPMDRPKYGLLNVCNDPFGPKMLTDRCHEETDCYLVLRRVRDRVTTTAKGSDGSICTLDSGLTSVLREFREDITEELKTVAELAMGVQPWKASDETFFKQVQIHGDVFFAQHVSHLVIPDRYIDQLNTAPLQLLWNFAELNGIFIVPMTEMKAMADARLDSREQLGAKIKEALRGLPSVGRIPRGRYESMHHLARPQTLECRMLYDEYCHIVCSKASEAIRNKLWQHPPSDADWEWTRRKAEKEMKQDANNSAR